MAMPELKQATDVTLAKEDSLKRKQEEGDANPSDIKKVRRTDVFKGFSVIKVLSEDSEKKLMVVHGRFADAEDKDAVVIVEKKPFSKAHVTRILGGDTHAQLVLQNDIYGTHEVFPQQELNGIKSTLIYPATAKHIAKYTQQDIRLISESAQDYRSITLPYLQTSQFSTKWVDNILEKKTESERIVFEDPHPETGFILLPDMKWDGKQTEDLYLVAIVHRNGIKSLRDLTTEHLPLLRNIHDNATKAIHDKYGVEASHLRTYLHYQPSYYHLHVHLTHLRYDAPGRQVERAHLLSDVIQNIEMCEDYYQRATLTFPVKVTDKLYLAFKEAAKE